MTTEKPNLFNHKTIITKDDTWKPFQGELDNRFMQGEHKDEGKPPMALLDSYWLEDTANVLGFGARKYAPNNYRYGIHHSRIISSIYRHISAINRGEDIDPESGLPHTAHLSCDAMFLHVMQRTKPELDDRWKDTNVLDTDVHRQEV